MVSLAIAIDASRTTRARRTGTENYALQLIRALIALDSPHRFWLYFREPPPAQMFPEHENVAHRVIPWRRAWTHTRLATALWRARPDVTFVPAHTLPLWFPGPAVVTVHDLGYVYFPEAHPVLSRRYLAWSTRHSVRRATRVIVDSLATGKDVAAHYGVPESQISLVYPGVDQTLERVTDQNRLDAVRAHYGLPEQYFLFVGTLQPRKNIARLVEAYARWRRDSGRTDVALVLAGAQGWLYDPAWTAGVEGVILPGYIADDDIPALYSAALALVFPSLHEGFGFPVLEAMRCGVPVVTSSTSSLPEVAGDAAVLVDPRSVEAITGAMARLAEDASWRDDLVARGYRQAQTFTWERAASQALEVLERAAREAS